MPTTTPRRVSLDTLTDVMEFDVVIEVHPDCTVSERPDLYAPELNDDELSPSGWTLLDGYSGQDRYSGPIMHPSEYIGGRMARDILSTPGVYVSLVAYYTTGPDGEPLDDDEGNVVDGWAVARRDDA